MKNIELKVFFNNFNKIVPGLKRLGASHVGMFNQTDTYYDFGNERFKIRETKGDKSMLIKYSRPDKFSSKISQYSLKTVAKNKLQEVKSRLAASLGEKVVVKKRRSLWIYRNTRIHLDVVNHLGKFLELETVVRKISFDQAKREHNKVINFLNLARNKKYDKSYSDMLINKLYHV